MASVTSMRIQPLNKQEIAAGKYVLYLMRSVRVRSSPSFSFASRRANESGVPLLPAFIYQPDQYNLAQRKFLLEGLICLRNALVTLGAPLLAIKATDEQKAMDIALKLSEQACEVITDAAYLRQDRTFEENLNEKLIAKRRRLTRVEGNVCVPVTVLCAKPAFNATTIRKVAWHLLEKLRLEKWD
ncbi:unnamed protein product, partial [Gongylonema pulchrum]|uniref:Photolyase/cryptochrome alpha/beta domain-containing protein n=1 Tax=Gongylonema pulchrum TaxID=637853 RepID=A0A183EH00_9BILA